MQGRTGLCPHTETAAPGPGAPPRRSEVHAQLRGGASEGNPQTTVDGLLRHERIIQERKTVCWCFLGERVPVMSACAAWTPPAACERAAGRGRLRQQGWSFLSERIGSREERKQAEFSPREKPQAWQRLLQVLKSRRETPGGHRTTQAVGPPPHAGWLASGAPRPWARAPSCGKG